MGGDIGKVVPADAADGGARAGTGDRTDIEDQEDLPLSSGDEGGEAAGAGEDVARDAGACGGGGDSAEEFDCGCGCGEFDVNGTAPFGFAQGRLAIRALWAPLLAGYMLWFPP
jgi:hypothetical protein